MPKLTEKSQVTIPLMIRKKLGVRPGDEVEFVVKGGVIVLNKKRKTGMIEKYRGVLGCGKTDEVMAQLR